VVAKDARGQEGGQTSTPVTKKGISRCRRVYHYLKNRRGGIRERLQCDNSTGGGPCVGGERKRGKFVMVERWGTGETKLPQTEPGYDPRP